MNHVYEGEVSTDDGVLHQYATDISIFSLTPTALYSPKSTEDIVALVQMCKKARAEGNNNASLTVRAGGTCMSGGPLNTGWIVDLTKHMHSVVVDPSLQTATVEMGAYFRDIETAAAKHGLMFAPYPSSRLICGIGGMIGNNASGEKSLRNGATGDNILELEVVLADGSVRSVTQKDISDASDTYERELVKLHGEFGERMREATGNVRKAASGYRLEKVVQGNTYSEAPLFVGSQGTLGIVTKAVLKLVPIPVHTELLMISAESLESISDIIETVLSCNPEGVETFDIHTFTKAREHLQEFAEKVVPYVNLNSHLFIMAQFSEETEEATLKQAKHCESLLAGKGYTIKHITSPDDVAAMWEVRRHSFLLMRDYNPEGFKAVPCIEDVIVPIESLGTFIEGLQKILTVRNIYYGFHGHIGEGSFRVVPVFDFNSPLLTQEIVGLMRDVFALVKKLKGNISADHSDGIIRTPFLREFYGEDLAIVFEKIKEIYDPENIMNPNKKVGGTIALMEKSINKG